MKYKGHALTDNHKLINLLWANLVIKAHTKRWLTSSIPMIICMQHLFILELLRTSQYRKNLCKMEQLLSKKLIQKNSLKIRKLMKCNVNRILPKGNFIKKIKAFNQRKTLWSIGTWQLRSSTSMKLQSTEKNVRF